MLKGTPQAISWSFLPNKQLANYRYILREFLKLVSVITVIIFFYHGYVAYNQISHRVNSEIKDTLAMSNFCTNSENTDNFLCIKVFSTRKLSQWDIESRIIHEFVREHMEHLPFYTYCTETDNCTYHLRNLVERLSYLVLLIPLLLVYMAVSHFLYRATVINTAATTDQGPVTKKEKENETEKEKESNKDK